MDKNQEYADDGSQNFRLISYWQSMGKVVAAFCVPILCFTVFLALKLDGIINWSYWLVFIPIFVTLLGFLLVTTSQSISGPVPVQVRVVWILWVIALSIFVVFLIFHMERATSFNPPYYVVFIPLYPFLIQ